jgi:hypothetical protein
VALTGGPVTTDVDRTDVEVYGSQKRGVARADQPAAARRSAPTTQPTSGDKPATPAPGNPATQPAWDAGDVSRHQVGGE